MPPQAVVERARTGRRLFGLADCGPFLGVSYPVASHDGGRTWTIAGPELWYAAAQGANGVLYIAAASSMVVIWGASLVASPDAGRHWWRTYFDGAIRTASVARGTITALAVADPIPGTGEQVWATWRYRSNDGGRAWYRLGPGPPAPPGPIGPHGHIHPTCG